LEIPRTKKSEADGSRAVMIAPIEPRCLSRDQAAAYCGCDSLSTFTDWVRRGIVPGPIPGTHRWDRKAIDAALDQASGLSSTVTERSDYAKWKVNRAHQVEGHQHSSASSR
jgi:hypothetical protein